MPQLGLQLVQAAAGDVLNIQKSSEQQQDKPYDQWQLHFNRQFNDLFNSIGGGISQKLYKFIRKLTVVTDHEVLVTLRNGNNKKVTKTIIAIEN